MQPARALDQILAELGSVYDPQVNSIRQRQALIPQQIADEERGLGARQEQAFGDILGGARRRGLGFSGIPLGEQAKYTSTEYLPALARLRQSGREQAMSLEDAILGIQERRRNSAVEQQRYEQQRYDAYRANQDNLAAQRASFGNLFGTPPPQQTPQTPADPYGNIDKQNANNAIHALLNTGNLGLIKNTINAITKSANAGNLYDRYKLELLQTITRGNSNAAFDPSYAKLLKAANTYKAPPAPVTIGMGRNKRAVR